MSSPNTPPLLLLFALFFQSLLCSAFAPSSFPLAIRSPYLNAWLQTPNASNLAEIWPTFWTGGSSIQGWALFIQVDNITFNALGNSPVAPNSSIVNNIAITPTQTIVTAQAGPMSVTINFLSPIEPDDLVKQSFPFSYMSVSVSSTDGNSHSVNIYSDISGEWFLTEENSVGEDGITYYGTQLGSGASWQIGTDDVVRGQFVSAGTLANTKDTNFRPINQNFPVFAHAVSLGKITSSSSPVVWAIGKTRDPAIQYTGASGTVQKRSSFFRSQYNQNISSAIDDFLSDFSAAQTRANTLDEKIVGDASTISSNYSDLVSLATRQTMAATEITVGQDSEGNWNTSDVKMFMRQMGTGTTVTPVDTLYASLPAFLYLNSTFAGYLLEPLLEYQATPAYTNAFAAANLGTAYPNATGNSAAHPQGVEQSGNMLIMVLAHARTSGNGILLSSYYNLLKGWAEYLVTHTLDPSGQTTADGLSQANMTNLAIKGIIGIQAMSEISQALQKPEDAKQYANKASSFVSQWASASTSSGHLTSTYGNSSSSGLMYNLYSDLLLKTNLVSNQIYQQQTTFYASEASSSPAFGLDFDTDAPGIAMSHWTVFTAATTTNSATRDSLISMVHTRAGDNETAIQGSFPTTYNSATGVLSDGQASAAQGAMFAVLALNITNVTITAEAVTKTSGSSPSTSNVAAIAGGVVGGVVVVGVLIMLVVVLRRRRKRLHDTDPFLPTPATYAVPHPYTYSDTHPIIGAVSTTSMQQHSINEGTSSDGGYYPSYPPAPSVPYMPPIAPSEAGSSNLQRQLSSPWSDAGTTRSPTITTRRSSISKGGRPTPRMYPQYGSTGYRPHLPSEAGGTSPSDELSMRSETLTTELASQLRNEVENLRREMLEIRQERAFDLPPPEYPAGETY